MIDELNKWANYHGFHLIVCEGKQLLKNSTKRTFKCNIKDCQYKIILKSDDKTFQVCENFHKNTQSIDNIKIYFVNNLFLDHALTCKRCSVFTNEIISCIKILKGRVKTFKSLTDIINKKYKTNFQITQIIIKSIN